MAEGATAISSGVESTSCAAGQSSYRLTPSWRLLAAAAELHCAHDVGTDSRFETTVDALSDRRSERYLRPPTRRGGEECSARSVAGIQRRRPTRRRFHGVNVHTCSERIEYVQHLFARTGT